MLEWKRMTETPYARKSGEGRAKKRGAGARIWLAEKTSGTGPRGQPNFRRVARLMHGVSFGGQAVEERWPANEEEEDGKVKKSEEKRAWDSKEWDFELPAGSFLYWICLEAAEGRTYCTVKAGQKRHLHTIRTAGMEGLESLPADILPGFCGQCTLTGLVHSPLSGRCIARDIVGNP